MRVKSEHAFGMLYKRFRIYDSTINLSQDVLNSTVFSTIAVHNFIGKTSIDDCFDDDFNDNYEYNDPLNQSTNSEENQNANAIRDQLVIYTNT